MEGTVSFDEATTKVLFEQSDAAFGGRTRAAHENQVQHAGNSHVGEVLALSSGKSMILLAVELSAHPA